MPAVGSRAAAPAGPLLGALLAPWVGYAESPAAVEPGGSDDGPVLPEEEALVMRAGAGRRADFRAGRRCAALALAQLGHPRRPLLRGRGRMPAWPPGVVGSITHRGGYRAAAVAHASDALAVGIDAELHLPLSARAREAVVLGPERERCRVQHGLHPGIAWDRLLFSAKESVYKAWSGAGGGWLGFEDAEVTAEVTAGPGAASSAVAAGTFRARLLTDAVGGAPLPRWLDGRWLVRDGLLLTAVVVLHGEHPIVQQSYGS